MSGLIGGTPDIPAVPAPVAYQAAPQAQSPQSAAAGESAANRTAASGGAGAALAGMQAGGLTEPATTTQKNALGG